MVEADPYPWPYDGPVDPKRLALVIAGAQLAWKGRSIDAEATADVITSVAVAVRGVGGLVVHLRHSSGSGGHRALPPAEGHPEWALVTEPAPLDLVVQAVGTDGFSGGPLDQELRSRHVDTLVFAGYGAEAAVSSTLRSANDRGYECLTLADATAPFEAETGHRTLHSITMSGGIFGAVAPSAAFLADLFPLPELTPAEALR